MQALCLARHQLDTETIQILALDSLQVNLSIPDEGSEHLCFSTDGTKLLSVVEMRNDRSSDDDSDIASVNLAFKCHNVRTGNVEWSYQSSEPGLQEVVPHNPLSPIGLAACLQVAAAIPNFAVQEYATGFEAGEFTSKSTHLGSDIVDYVPLPHNGFVDIPSGPGLGMNLVPDAQRSDRPWSSLSRCVLTGMVSS